MPEDLKEYVNQHGFEEFCLKHTFDKMLFDNFYNAIIRSDAEVENWANLTEDILLKYSSFRVRH